MIQDLQAILTRRDRWRVLILVVMMLAGALAEAVGIGAVFPFLALLADPGRVDQIPWLRGFYEASGVGSPQAFLVLSGLVLMSAYWIKNGYLSLLYLHQARFVFGKETELAKRLLHGYLAAPYDSLAARNTSSSVRIVANEVNRVANGVLLPLLVLVAEILVVAAIVLLLFMLEPFATLAALALFGFLAAVLQRLLRPAISRMRDQRIRAHAAMFKWVGEALGSIKEVKVFSRSEFFESVFRAHSDAHSNANKTFWYLGAVPRLFLETLGVTAIVLVLSMAISSGKSVQEVLPLIAVFALASVRLIPSVNRLISAFNSLRFFAPSLRAVSEDLLRAQQVDESGVSLRPSGSPPFAELELLNIAYQYPGTAVLALKDISLRIRRGEMIAVVGSSGSGKTTLIDLLAGLLEPESGEILVNGQAERKLGKNGISVGLVPQQFYLVDDSIRRNVAFGIADAEIDDEKVWAALRLARMDQRVAKSPLLLDLPVGERGELLSGGEGQRICIARALYVEPDMLILDEATSALDSAIESEIMDTLKTLAGTRTVVLVTHRPSSMRYCDRVVVLKDGKIDLDAKTDEIPASILESQS